jgi:hypothetical protein
MKDVHITVGVLAITLNVVACLLGGWSWYQSRPSVSFWRVMRAAQVSIVIQAALGGILVAIGDKVTTLHLVYGLLPIAVSLFGEQLRIGSAQAVLDAEGLESARDVGTLPAEDQRAVVAAIVRREVGVMALAAFIIVVLLARAAMTAP